MNVSWANRFIPTASALRELSKTTHCLTPVSYNESDMYITRLISTVAAVSVTLAACGGSSSESSSDTQAPPGPTATSDALPPETEPLATEAPTTTSAPTTTVAPAPDPFDLTALPDLVAAADAAVGDPTVDPFGVVDDIVGFPVPIPVPDGSTLLQFDAILSFVSEDGTTGWNARYDAVAPGGAVDDIDLALDGNGPGSQQVIDIYDPIMADLGFERKNSTASDPGDSGGPNSVNHVYVAPDPAWDVNGVPATLDPLFIWSSEDVNGWAYDDSLAELGGYTVDIGFDTATSESTPFPLANAVLDAFPVADGLELSDLSISMRERSADSFSIDKGATYLDVVLEWEAPADALDAIVGFYADPAALFTDEAVLMAGEDDFFNEGAIARTESYAYDTTDTRLDMLLLQRYGALFGIDASDDGIEPVTLRLDIELNPNDIQLALPTE